MLNNGLKSHQFLPSISKIKLKCEDKLPKLPINASQIYFNEQI